MGTEVRQLVVDKDEYFFFWMAPNNDAGAGGGMSVAADGYMEWSVLHADLAPTKGAVLRITEAMVGIQGYHQFGRGRHLLKIESNDMWKIIAEFRDGSDNGLCFRNHNPGILMTPNSQLCLESNWLATPAGPCERFGGNSQQRVIQAQIRFHIEP